MKASKALRHLRATDARAALQIAVHGTQEVTDVVEGVHRAVHRTMGLRTGAPGRTAGVTGWVYRSVRNVTQVVGQVLDAGLTRLLADPVDGDGDWPLDTPEREQVVSALNGVLGDRLAGLGNPLALTMTLRANGLNLPLTRAVPSDQPALAASRVAVREVLARAAVEPTPHVLVMVHGLAMTDNQWQQGVHDHGPFLAAALGCTPLYLRYNTGLHIADNGAQLAELLQALVANWPVPVQSLRLLGHSMGGLVARSACWSASQSGQTMQNWLGALTHLVTLGTPHHGAPLEQVGSWVDEWLGHAPWLSRYTAPFARLGQLRSAGITDLRFGHLTPSDWHGRDRFRRQADTRTSVPLPPGVVCAAAAATLAPARGLVADRLLGDGLVPLRSALGQHDDRRRTLAFGPGHQKVFFRMGHIGLLGSPDVAHQVLAWMQESPARG